PEYFMYSEDADLCRRIRNAGYDVYHLPRWQVLHRHGTSARRRPEFAFRRLYRSMLIYTRKHLPGWSGRALRAAVLLDMALRLPVYLLNGNGERLSSLRRVLAMYSANDPTLFPDEAPRG
ncbi:glycosyltransferase family 2 protein, partial [Candidatus Poribacteria bacterium]|nr:glycosyltransferase family 2 protein [Candidatus Poribacteria bacterium]